MVWKIACRSTTIAPAKEETRRQTSDMNRHIPGIARPEGVATNSDAQGVCDDQALPVPLFAFLRESPLGP